MSNVRPHWTVQLAAQCTEHKPEMLVSRFYGLPQRHINHKPWRLANLPQERVRGAIRGAASRERLLHPSPAKALQRRIRFRLLAAYRRRFGEDSFVLAMSAPKFRTRAARFWLPSGYAWWKERLLGRFPQRPYELAPYAAGAV
jgi:hypothetical protein